MSSLTYLTVLSLLALAASPPSDAASSIVAPTPRAPRGPTTTAQFLSAINAARADAEVPPLSWNVTVAQRVKLHMNWFRTSAGCDLSQDYRNPIHTKMALSRYRGYGHPAPADVVGFWVAERRWYDHGADACAAGKECESYKLVVKREWRQLGCALVACPSGGALAGCGYRPRPGGKPREPQY